MTVFQAYWKGQRNSGQGKRSIPSEFHWPIHFDALPSISCKVGWEMYGHLCVQLKFRNFVIKI